MGESVPPFKVANVKKSPMPPQGEDLPEEEANAVENRAGAEDRHMTT